MPTSRSDTRRGGTVAPARPHHPAHIWWSPVLISAFFGFYAGFLDQEGGAPLGWAWLVGGVSGVALLAVWLAFHAVRGKLLLEVRAACYGALTGGAVGYLVGLSGASVLKSAAIGFFVGAGMGVAVYYRLFTRPRRPARR
ncbi:hypothetical protein [Streptomyces zingiberis]|uniref:Uncharacterized protein n=1 Tax=Streptomyces zingiberis TaxID=2053010 RepID=A0ABX1BS91_9ACTN|nr:hypothetical protein [Streptomyces zingiberis]NJQ00591.1 hypothetical protein [Streptomyces zingiberis]